MTVHAAATTALVDQGPRVRLLVASSIGTIVEWYDFAIFAVCAALVAGASARSATGSAASGAWSSA